MLPKHTELASTRGDIARLISYFFLTVVASSLFFAARAIPTSRFERVGAGAFPSIIFALLALLSLLAFLLALCKIPISTYRKYPHQVWQWCKQAYLVFILLIALGLYLLLLPIIGFSIATFIFLLSIQLTLAQWRLRNLLIAIIIAVLFSCGLNALFASVFHVYLPGGFWQ